MVLPEEKVEWEKWEVRSGCTVCEGQITHAHGRLAAFDEYSYMYMSSIVIACGTEYAGTQT